MLDTKLIIKASASYNIEIKKMEVMSSGVMNDVYLVVTTDGKKYILKKIRNSCIKRAQEEALLLQILAKNNDLKNKIIDVLPNKYNDYITIVDGTIFSLSSYIDGISPKKLSDEQLEDAINIVSIINKIGKNYDPAIFSHRVMESSHSVNLFFHQISQEDIINTKVHTNISNITATFFQLLKKYRNLTTIHRDAGKSNMIIDRSGSIHLIDFDDFIIGSLIVELSVLIRGTCFFNECCFNFERAGKIFRYYSMQHIDEKFDLTDLYYMIIYDLVRCIQGRLSQPHITQIEKQIMFKETYARILLLQNNKNYFLTVVTNHNA